MPLEHGRIPALLGRSLKTLKARIVLPVSSPLLHELILAGQALRCQHQLLVARVHLQRSGTPRVKLAPANAAELVGTGLLRMLNQNQGDKAAHARAAGWEGGRL